MFKGLILSVLAFLFLQNIAWCESPYNIILIINDQETFKLAPAIGYQLPAREMLKQKGVTFTHHYTAAAMCTPSRATFLTGVTPQVNGTFDQMEYSYVPNLNPTLHPTMGSILKHLGYRTAYFGKFEMSKAALKDDNKINYSTLIQPYGFDTFNPDGDVGGEPQQGYQVDAYYAGEAVRWLRQNAQKKEKPFFLVVSLLNPHDIMYGDANIPGTPVAQKPHSPVILPPPDNTLYKKRWHFPLSATLNESITNLPNALQEYQAGWAGALGYIPTERKDMWDFYYNYYLNALRDNDRSLKLVVDAINEMDLWKNTVVILTADHGEMGGAHGGLRGKGPMIYEENSHIPLIIDHPKGPQNITCSTLTSHLDLLPTLVGLTGLPEAMRRESTKGLAGHDFSFLLTQPEKDNLHAIRKAILFNYVGISTVDGKYLQNTLVSAFSHHTLPALTEVNLNKRGFLSFVFDGRYKYARYYAPNTFNQPKTLAQIFKYNDVQLFDLQKDPQETQNLALKPEENKTLILRMNDLLNELMEKEVGINDGKFLPESIRPKTPPLTFKNE